MECRGTLREGPDATVIVSGYARMSWIPVLLIGFFCLVWTPNALKSYSSVDALACAGLPLVVLVIMLLSAGYDRNQLINMIVESLTDQRKGKTKKPKRERV